MIHFNQIANPSTPSAKPMCVACEGRGASIDGEGGHTGRANRRIEREGRDITMRTFFQWLMQTPVTIGTLKPKPKPKRTKRTIKEVYNKR